MRYNLLRHGLVVVVAELFVLSTAHSAQMITPKPPQEGEVSHVRVVRLSYESGDVSVMRPGSNRWEKAPVNTPLQEGFELRTSNDSYAEAEFENGSTARLGEISGLTFNQLALSAQGGKLNRLTFERGYATFNFLPERQDAYSVTIADATVTPEGKSEFRVDFIQGQLRIEAFHGSVRVATPSKSAKLGEGKTLEYNPGMPEAAFKIRNEIEEDDWDRWTEARDKQAQLALRDESVKTQGGLYGWSDLNSYGEWADIPGSGYGWAPYVQTGWSPFSAGMWNWYPTLGWTWVSSEPWGWLPYHCGLWDYDFGFGWFWTPAGGCGLWEPALVAWFHGPGWIGWCPAGGHVGPRAGRPRPVHPTPGHLPPFEHLGANGITTVAMEVFDKRQMLSPQLVSHVGPGQGTFMGHAPPGPSATAVISAGLTSNRTVSTSSFTPNKTAAHPAVIAGRAEPATGIGGSPAPPTILMGADPAKESTLLAAHQLGSSHQPLTMVMGPTLGGQFVMSTSPGESLGAGVRGPISYGWSAVVIMEHGHGSSPRIGTGGLISGGHEGHFGRGGGHSWGGGHFGGGGHSGGGGHFGGGGHSGGGGGHH